MRKVILFGEDWKRQVREARNLLEDLNINYKFFDTTSSAGNRLVLFGLIETANSPVMFDNGVMYNGISEIKKHLS